ncbi:MAG: GNAT family N-acetyltransferase [Vampirovibrio sp.]|nr:GNAT family N-acetyltransferase [Vampirovibrio sp.]
MLNNPIWKALNSQQQGMSTGNDLARVFDAVVSPLSGMVEPSPEAYAALGELAKDGRRVVLFLEQVVSPPAGWALEVEGALTQMIWEGSALPTVGVFDIEPLGETDVPEMLALAKLTKPGPFETKTITMGQYLGIRQEGRLVAMAGERLHLSEGKDGYTEISAVCTHPDFQGRGYAKALMVALMEGVLNRGEIPMLHAWKSNTGAIAVYEKLGFVESRVLQCGMIRCV